MQKTLERLTEELIKQEKSIVDSLNSAKIGMWSLDMASGTLSWDKKMFDLFDKDPTTFKYKYEDFQDSLHEEDIEPTNNAVKNTLESGVAYLHIFRVKLRNGKYRHILGKGGIVTDSNGNKTKLCGICIEIPYNIA